MGILLSETAATTTEGGGSVGSLITMIAVYAIFFFAMWFFLFRPQSKEKKKMAAMLSQLAIGDCVLTTSGFYGVVIDIADDTVIVGNSIAFFLSHPSFLCFYVSQCERHFPIILTEKMIFFNIIL